MPDAPEIEITIRKGDLLITQPFADEAQQREVFQAFAYSFNPKAQAIIADWEMSLAQEHAAELGLPDGFSHDDLAGIKFGHRLADSSTDAG